MVFTVAWSSLLGFGGTRWKCDLPPNTQGCQSGSRHYSAVSPGHEVSERGSHVGLVLPSPSPHPLGPPVLHVDRGRGGQMHRNCGAVNLTSRENGLKTGKECGAPVAQAEGGCLQMSCWIIE